MGPILSNNNTDPSALLGGVQSFLNYSGVYPLAGAIFFGPIYNFLIFLVVSIAILFIFFKVATKVYYNRFILAKLESTGKKKKGKVKGMDKVDSPFKALLKWDFMYLFKNPMFFLYTLFSAVLMPFSLLVPFYFLTKVNTEKESLQGLMGSISSFVQSENAIWIVMVIVLVVCFISFTSAASTSAFSMDGTYFYFKKLLPVKTSWLYWSKTIIAYVFSLITCVVAVVIGGIIGLGITDLVNLFLLSALFLLPLTLLSVYMDSLRPYMKWATPKMCLNKNINSLFSMITGSLFMGIIILISVALGLARLATPIPSLVIYLIFYILGLIILGSTILLVKKTGNIRISKIQKSGKDKTLKKSFFLA